MSTVSLTANAAHGFHPCSGGIRNDVVERVVVESEPSAYLQRLNEQAVKDGVYPKHRKEKKKGYKELVKSPADPTPVS